MKLSRRFPNDSEAWAFGAGLRAASEGDVHSIKVEHSPTAFMFEWEVTWIDENKKAAELPARRPPLTPDQYVARKGNVCPVCRGSDIKSCGRVATLNDQAFQPITCTNPDCEASWTDCYELSGYDNLET